jgi:trans-aconitate methyltransferase
MSVQSWNSEQYAREARFVAELGAPVLELLAPKPGERILDLGCGDGALTRLLAAKGCSVVGVDSSPAFIDAARALGLDARIGDARTLSFDGEFDAVFSNAVLHWVRPPETAIDGVWRALRPGGRFVGEMGGHGCVAAIVGALGDGLAARGLDASLVNPWYFPSVADYGARLVARGFRIESIELIPRPTPLPGELRGWLETFAQSFTSALPEGERAGFLDEVSQRLRPALCDAAGRWTADYVRLRFRVVRPIEPTASLRR